MTTFTDHCETVYNALAERATINIKTDELVFTGAISQVYRSLGISQSYYSSIFDTLEEVGSILKIQKGARSVDTVMALRGLPEVWPEHLTQHPKKDLTGPEGYATLVLDVKKIQDSIGSLNVIEALINLDTRLGQLEAMLNKEKAPHGKGKGNTTRSTNPQTNTGE